MQASSHTGGVVSNYIKYAFVAISATSLLLACHIKGGERKLSPTPDNDPVNDTSENLQEEPVASDTNQEAPINLSDKDLPPQSDIEDSDHVVGVIDGNSGEYLAIKTNPWFLGNKPIPYCIEYPDNDSLDKFSVPIDSAKKVIQGVLDDWKTTFDKISSKDAFRFEINKWNEQWVGYTFIESDCHDKMALKFLLGKTPEYVKAVLSDSKAVKVGMALRTAYDEKTGQSQGVVWIPPDAGPNAIINSQLENFSWQTPDFLRAVLLHEVGHILGVPHDAITVMNQHFPFAFLKDEKFRKRMGDESLSSKYFAISNFADFSTACYTYKNKSIVDSIKEVLFQSTLPNAAIEVCVVPEAEETLTDLLIHQKFNLLLIDPESGAELQRIQLKGGNSTFLTEEYSVWGNYLVPDPEIGELILSDITFYDRPTIADFQCTLLEKEGSDPVPCSAKVFFPQGVFNNPAYEIWVFRNNEWSHSVSLDDYLTILE